MTRPIPPQFTGQVVEACALHRCHLPKVESRLRQSPGSHCRAGALNITHPAQEASGSLSPAHAFSPRESRHDTRPSPKGGKISHCPNESFGCDMRHWIRSLSSSRVIRGCLPILMARACLGVLTKPRSDSNQVHYLSHGPLARTRSCFHSLSTNPGEPRLWTPIRRLASTTVTLPRILYAGHPHDTITESVLHLQSHISPPSLHYLSSLRPVFEARRRLASQITATAISWLGCIATIPAMNNDFLRNDPIQRPLN